MAEERAIVYVTKGLHPLSVIEYNKPYAVVDLTTRVILDSDDKTLIGKEWPEPPPKSFGSSGSGSIPRPPLFIELALWLWKAKFSHDTIYGVLPPKLRIKVQVKPTKGYVQYHWAMTFGETVNPNVVITHWQEPGMKEHEDPLIVSIVRHVYPLSLRVSEDRPHVFLAENRDVTPQLAEATMWYIEGTLTDAETIDAFIRAWTYHYLVDLYGPEMAKELVRPKGLT